MIISYSIENFKSIKYRETISFKAKSYKETKIKSIDNNLLSVISIYGPNGGGKSSIIESMFNLVNIIKINLNKNLLNIFLNELNKFKNSTQKDKPIKWEIEIISPSKRYYRYFLEVDQNEISKESLCYAESQNGKEEFLFKRTSPQEYELGKKFNGIKLRATDFGSLLSYLYTNIENEFIIEFFNEINNKFFIINNLNNDPMVLTAKEPFNLSLNYNFNIDVLIKEKEKFLKIFKEIDINIVDYKLVEQINGKRFVLIKNNEDGEFELDFSQESEGTKKIIQLMSWFVIGIHNGWVFVVDELDSRLHTKLLGYIIDLFHNKNNHKSQIIFTSHDMNTLSSTYLRKDEIYFVGLNESYFTNVVSLSAFDNVREKSSYSSKYLKGSFGFDPYVLRAIEWLDNEK
ncbi:ATP/GTP-binding protein [Mesomycoplasma moatsii]|uniref:AAA family ATPase n=1 Tax=Mesomycoplasma moatsii TaxID=171287 RepID=UPI0003B3CAFF